MPLDFDERGLLTPTGLLDTTWTEVATRFVTDFPQSKTRRFLFEQYTRYVGDLREAVSTGFVQWLDGSFVTQKLHPRDIDFVTFLPFHPDQPLDALVERFRRRRIDSRGVLDGYFVIDYPQGHAWHPFSQADYVDWLHRFGTSRKFERKGIVQLHF